MQATFVSWFDQGNGFSSSPHEPCWRVLEANDKKTGAEEQALRWRGLYVYLCVCVCLF